MHRSRAFCAAAAVLCAAPAAAVQPLDVNLAALGAPSAPIWSTLYQRANPTGAPLDGATAGALASQSIQRYRTLMLQLGLGITSFALEPPTTGGRLGLEVALEGAWAQVKHDDSGTLAPPVGPPVATWPVRGPDPSALRLAAFHVRKPLPWSFEVGARVIYPDQTELAAAQGELRWAVNESWGPLPDFAFRVAYTRLFGQRDLELQVLDVDATVGKKLAVGGSMRITPWASARVSALAARTSPIDFGPASACGAAGCFPDTRPPDLALATVAPFPDLKFRDHRVLRWALGAQLEAAAFSAAAEGSWSDVKSFGPREGLAPTKLPRSLGLALRAGLRL